MKIIYIDSARLPTEKAHGYQTCKMCEEFSRADIEVELLIPNRSNYIKKDVFDYYGLERIFKVKKLFCLNLVWLERFGFLFQTIIFLIFSRFYLLSQKYDILYTRDKLTGVFFGDFVLETHVLPEKIGLFYRWVWGKARLIIVLNGFLKNKITEAGIAEKEILVAPDAVDLKKFDIEMDKKDACQKLELPFDKKIVLYAGHLYDWKGVDILALAAGLLSSDFLVIFVGGAEEDIDRFKKQNAGVKNILITGHKSYKEIPVWLKAADVLILTGTAKSEISKYYTSPLKMFEYMASGRPVIAPRLDSFSDILNDGNSFLVEADNPAALAEGIKKISSDEFLAKKISEQAHLDAEKYTWAKRAAAIIDFYKNQNKLNS